MRVERIEKENGVCEEGWRGIVSTASTSVSKTESPGSNPGAPAKKTYKCVLKDVGNKSLFFV